VQLSGCGVHSLRLPAPILIATHSDDNDSTTETDSTQQELESRREGPSDGRVRYNKWGEG